MAALTNSYGGIRRGRVWFTTSPEQLKLESQKKTPKYDTTVVVRRRRSRKDQRVRPTGD